MEKKKNRKKNLDFKATPKRRFDDPWRYLYAFLIAIFLMAFGFLVSYYINSLGDKQVSSLQDQLFYDFYEKQLIYDLFDYVNKCDVEQYEKISQILDFQGSMLAKLEQDFGKNSKKVLDKKRRYYVLEASHYNFMKKLNDECDLGKNFILFFYSNDKESIDKSERIGRMLTHLKAIDDSFMIYSFDVNSDAEVVKMFKTKYGVDKPLEIILNDNVTFTDLKNINQILSQVN